MSKSRTFAEHAKRLAKLAIFSNAYGMPREKTDARLRQHLEKYFQLVPTEAAPFRTKNPENLVRIHLRQALLLGQGKGAKYAHTLIGERLPPLGEQYGGTGFVAVNVFGFVRGGVDGHLEHPARHLLAANNILSIEDVKIEHVCTEGC